MGWVDSGALKWYGNGCEIVACTVFKVEFEVNRRIQENKKDDKGENANNRVYWEIFLRNSRKWVTLHQMLLGFSLTNITMKLFSCFFCKFF